MNVVISGTSSGIGKALALRYLKEGFYVFGIDLLEATISHEHYHHFLCDIRSDSLPDIADLHIVVCNAGTLEESEALDVNLFGTMHFAEHYLASPVLHSVLFIASASARNGAEFPRYVASKAGIVGYMKNLSLSLATRGVTCNSISPGGVVTLANRHILEDEHLYTAVKAETLLGKWAQPEEIADLAHFLTVTNQSITGEDILIDNGEMLKSNFIW